MRITFDNKVLREAVSKVFTGISTRAPLPSLSGILIEAKEGGEVIFTSTDLEIGIITHCQAEVEEAGRGVIPGKVIYSLSKSLREKEVSLVFYPDFTIEIESGKTYLKISGFSPEDFPTFPPFPTDVYSYLKGDELKIALSQVRLSLSKDETRHSLTGVLFHFHKDRLNLVSTDGSRLGFCPITIVEGNIPPDSRYIVPEKVVSELVRAIPETSTVRFSPGRGEVLFEVGDLSIFSRVIEGDFPDYESVILEDFTTLVKFNRRELLECLERVTLASLDEDKMVNIFFRKNSLEVVCQSSELGVGREEITVETEGEEEETAFNGGYLIDALRVSRWERGNLGLGGKKAPAKIFGEGDAYQSILMPFEEEEEGS